MAYLNLNPSKVSMPVRIGLIGSGWMGAFHAESIARRVPGAVLAANADPNLESAGALAGTLGTTKMTADAADLLADPAIDAVVIASPARFHSALIGQAAAAGKHVFCEKPAGLGLEELDAALAAVESAGVHFQIGFNRRYAADFQAAKKDLAVVPLMPIWRNFFLGSELTSGFGPFKSMDVEKMKDITLKELAAMGIDLRDVEQPIGQLSGGERQCVAIARAVYFGAKVLILDEPTAALGVKQSGVVLRYILQARDRGLGVIFITHNPHHAFPVGDRFLLLKRGKSIGYYDKKDITLDELTAQMAGGAELAELAHELEQLGGHNEALKEVQAEVAEVADTAPAGGPKHG